MNEYTNVTIATLANGALDERFQVALESGCHLCLTCDRELLWREVTK